MSTFVPTKQHLREALLFCFNLKKSAAEGHRLICEAYGEHAPSIKTCEDWLRRFKSGDFDTSDKEREEIISEWYTMSYSSLTKPSLRNVTNNN